jgi:nitroreductase
MEERKSDRAAFDLRKPVSREILRQIVEAARWAPSPHNMQNFEIIVVDDKASLKKIGRIRSTVSEAFIRENYEQLSFSKEELLRKKVGILGSHFPPAWRDPKRFGEALRGDRRSTLSDTMDGCPAALVVVYDPRKRAPDSEGDFLGILGLGCVMENIWLAATALKVSYQVMSVFGEDEAGGELKRALGIPSYMKVAYAVRLGYPVGPERKYLRVRRDLKDVVHHNRYGERGLRLGSSDSHMGASS